jgi:predicted nucleic acid-binding protein
LKYLLDTNAISETLKSRPNQGFLDWLDTVVSLPEELDDTLYVSVLSLAEMRRGALKLAPGSRRAVIENRIAAMVEDYNDRLLTVDLAVGERWAMLAEHYKPKRNHGWPDRRIDRRDRARQRLDPGHPQHSPFRVQRLPVAVAVE